jgi:MFS family permease
MSHSSAQRLAHFLALNRTVAIVLLMVLLFGLGEELWGPFMPTYLHALDKVTLQGASTLGEVGWLTLWVVGLYGFVRNLFEGFCYIGGGQLTARLGDRGSLLLIGSLTIMGYILFLAVAADWAAILAALLIVGWEPLSVPVTFTTVGSTVSAPRQGMAFAIQSIQKRLPKIIGPAVAGVVIATVGQIAGMRLLVSTSLVLTTFSLLVQWLWMPHRAPSPPGPPLRRLFRQFPPRLRRLLTAEIFTRWCDWLVRNFVVLYVVVTCGLSPEFFGLLVATQNLTALMTYLPIGRMTAKVGLEPFIGLTFIFFALFPVVLALVPANYWLFLAFVVYGLREIGEPARKAMITNSLPEPVRARGVGLYWGIRSFALCTAPLAGAWIWNTYNAHILLFTASGVGCVGAAIFYLFCRQDGDFNKE